MRFVEKICIWVIVIVFAGVMPLFAGKNLIENGSFDDPENPFKGWTIDWEWDGTTPHKGIPGGVSLIATDGAKKTVMRVSNNNGSIKEPVICSPLVPFEYGKQYKVTIDAKSDGEAPVWLFVRGYKWAPGVKPYDNPHVGDLRLIFKSEPITASKAWKTISMTFPKIDYSKQSELSLSHMKPIRFIAFYLVIAGGFGPGTAYIDNLKIE